MKTKIIAAVTAIAALTAGYASAEVQLQAVSCFPQGSFFSKRFEALVEAVNEAGAGEISINYVGGAPAIGSPLTVMQKVSQGVYDLSSCTGAYYQNVLPEADAWKLLERTPTEIRENGGWDYINALHNEKNIEVLARHHYGTQFHLYLADGHAIDKPDLTGLHLRTAPIYTSFFKSLGATTQDAGISQIFSLMENGTVKGYGWPALGHQPGWETVTKYRVDPGFYDVDLMIFSNLKAWNGLPQSVRDLISAEAIKLEEAAIAGDAALNDGARARQAEAGFEVITFSEEDTAAWLSGARDAGWGALLANSPTHGAKLRELFASE
jgi:TRAP-type C4-dicarboxylate transport system substrate-binding protein